METVSPLVSILTALFSICVVIVVLSYMAVNVEWEKMELWEYTEEYSLKDGRDSIEYTSKPEKGMFGEKERSKVYVTIEDGNTKQIEPNLLNYGFGEDWELHEAGTILKSNNKENEKTVSNYLLIGPDEEIIELVQEMSKELNREFKIIIKGKIKYGKNRI